MHEYFSNNTTKDFSMLFKLLRSIRINIPRTNWIYIIENILDPYSDRSQLLKYSNDLLKLNSFSTPIFCAYSHKVNHNYEKAEMIFKEYRKYSTDYLYNYLSKILGNKYVIDDIVNTLKD